MTENGELTIWNFDSLEVFEANVNGLLHYGDECVSLKPSMTNFRATDGSASMQLG